MKKRVGIARAISLNPSYLFCDEPNSGLDPLTSRVIDELIKEITEEYNITTIINTHDMKSVFDMGENIIFIWKGKKWWDGHRKQIRTSGNEELYDFMKAYDIEYV
jgi:phospholipid/cholesterol/gamma-HCH transport system ATP-binding protein